MNLGYVVLVGSDGAGCRRPGGRRVLYEAIGESKRVACDNSWRGYSSPENLPFDEVLEVFLDEEANPILYPRDILRVGRPYSGYLVVGKALAFIVAGSTQVFRRRPTRPSRRGAWVKRALLLGSCRCSGKRVGHHHEACIA